jgi:hypothetical protein
MITFDNQNGCSGSMFFSEGGKFQGWELWEECTYTDLSEALTQVQREPTRAAIASSA